MKKFLIGLVTALTLSASTAYATDSLYSPDFSSNSTLQIQALDTGAFNDMRTLLHFNNGNGPKMIAEPDYFYVGTDKFTDLMAAKASASDVATLSATVSGISAQQPSDWDASSGVTRILNKPTVPTNTNQLTNGAGFITSAPVSSVASKTGVVTLNSDDLADGTTNKLYSATDKTKLAGIASGATANSLDATLENRANHTGTQSVSTITGLATVATSGSYSDLSSKPSIPTVYDGTTARTNPVIIFKSATVASGAAVMYLTADNTSTGTALCPNGVVTSSINPIVNDSTASYQMSWAVTNSNKTLTVTTNNFTTANILTGLLGQAAANGKTVNASVVCY